MLCSLTIALMQTLSFWSLLGLTVLAPTLMTPAIADIALDWDFEDGEPGFAVNLATDTSGQGNHGRIRLGAPTFVETTPGAEPGQRSMQVTGSGLFGSAMVARESPALNLATGSSFTVEAIFRPVGDNTRANRTLVQRSDPQTLIFSYGLYYDGDSGQANFGVSGADGESVLVYAPVPNDGQFHRLAGIFDHGQLFLYVDGVLKTNATTKVIPDPRPKNGVAVGAIFNGGFYFNGEIARVRLARRALQPAEFLQPAADHFEGIPHAWWNQWFGDGWATDSRAKAAADPDDDGRNNLAEYRALTHPLDPNSGFEKSLKMVPRIAWRSVPGGVYRIERRDSLGSSSSIVVVPEFTATGQDSSYVDESASKPNAFYSIERIR